MANSKRKFVALCLCACAVTGCASVKVVRDPAANDKGVRFYRPKPYLLVTPADPTGRLVNMKLEYLPDFNEEYSAHLKGKASVALKDGWNLVGVNTKEAPKDKEEPPAKIEAIPLPPAVVAATNVPIGYYESVYGFDAANGGKKFLQGWRYIGMTSLGGGQPGVCRVSSHKAGCPNDNKDAGCINGPLYGLVFFNGVMTFRQLDEIANNQLCPMFVNPAPAPAAATPPAEPFRGPGLVEPESGPRPKGAVEKDAAPIPPAVPAPPVPSPATPPVPGSASLARPRVTPALATVAPGRPAASTAPSRPVASPVLAARPAALPPLGARPAASPAPVFRKVASAPAPPARATAAPKVAATPSPSAPASLDRDPLATTPPSLDRDLFRTGTSPRP